ncbi:MAG: dihydroorotate dehydrogenase [Coriobacteriales bacterium]|nr:dihydroorotate dehydrogenase [Coriobacteriales bacterium]
MSADLATRIGKLTMKNPVTTASGTFASGMQYSEFFELSRLGAVTTKGVSLEPWRGNDGVRIAESPSGMLNSIGLQNPGVEAFCAGDLAWLSQQGVPIIVNVSGHSVAEFAAIIERLEEEGSVDAYELNVSCPNVDSGGMTFGTDPAAVAQIMAACRKATERTIIVKLTPNVTDIVSIARAVVDEGADALSLINTLLAMAIDARTRKAVFNRKVAGLSGPAIKPVALRMVYEVHKAIDVPLIGMGGIACAEDAIEFILAGASAVAIGSANFIDPLATIKVIDGIERYLEDNAIGSVSELIGALE